MLLAAHRENKAFAIYATAPSMDGFASDSSPVLVSGFKLTLPAKQPELILADTEVLASAPPELKAAGFGDMAAKYTALADWRMAAALTGEYYCPKIAELVLRVLKRSCLCRQAESKRGGGAAW
jgi:glycerol-1-phosphate dehydrogenase [NAD(P)+]